MLLSRTATESLSAASKPRGRQPKKLRCRPWRPAQAGTLDWGAPLRGHPFFRFSGSLAVNFTGCTARGDPGIPKFRPRRTSVLPASPVRARVGPTGQSMPAWTPRPMPNSICSHSARFDATFAVTHTRCRWRALGLLRIISPAEMREMPISLAVGLVELANLHSPFANSLSPVSATLCTLPLFNSSRFRESCPPPAHCALPSPRLAQNVLRSRGFNAVRSANFFNRRACRTL